MGTPARIDAHQHFWSYSAESHGWIDDSMAALRRDFLPADLEPLLREGGFDGCVAVQAEQDVAETEWLLALADEHEYIRGVVGWVDLRSDGVQGQLAHLKQRPKFKGVRHVVQSEPDDRFMLRPDFMRGIAALAEFDLAYDILVYPRQLAAATELAAAFPDQRFVLDHIGKPPIRDGEIDAWARGIAALTRNRNVHCKLSGMVTEAAWSDWSADDFTPYIDVIFDWFGPERVMIGSDWPVCTLGGSYADVLGIALRRVAQLSLSDQDAVMGGNAVRFYRL
jgi:L-fucono-1,5-lactonase